MLPPGLITEIACCLDISNPTVSKTISKLFSFTSLSFGLTNLPSKYFEQHLALVCLDQTL